MNEVQIPLKDEGAWLRLQDVMEQVCNSDDESEAVMDDLAQQARTILLGHGSKKLEEINFQDLEDCFNSCEESLTNESKSKEFDDIQVFILEEQTKGRQRRKLARRVEATEEKRLAADVAELKGYRLRTQIANTHEILHHKVADAERSYFSRKMVIARSAQVANSECRLQFSRVRDFFDRLHHSRRDALRRQYRRSIKLQSLTHRLRNTDERVAALERQIANRLYHKKKSDLNELHMTQNMEEAMYLESMLDLLFKVQQGKESAARELFELHVGHLKEQRVTLERRNGELADLRADATLEMARVVAHYTEEEDDNLELEEQVRENVDSMERHKNFHAAIPILSVSQLYDSVLWSVAMSETSASSLYSSDFDGSDDLEVANEPPEEPADHGSKSFSLDLDDSPAPDDADVDAPFSETASTAGSTCDGSVTSGGGSEREERSRISLVGKIHVKQLSKELRRQENELIAMHAAERKAEVQRCRAEARALKKKHQRVVEGLLQKCLYERHNMREGIVSRMKSLSRTQETTTRMLRDVIESDIKIMQAALRSEDRRVEDAEKTSFIKAQELISSQVFHEVRNALSSMISMSEMTASLKNDITLAPTDLVDSVDAMLDQIKEVVNYSLNMLNNVLDVSKIKSGSFNLDCKPFDVQELVSRATRMQLAKTGRVKMSFVPHPEPLIACTDSDVMQRIVTNFISNAIKFTTSGAIQPFVWNMEDMFPHRGGQHCGSDSSVNSSVESDEPETEKRLLGSNYSFHGFESDMPEETLCTDSTVDENSSQLLLPTPRKTKLMAVGVADTGSGLSKVTLRESEKGLSSSDSTSMVSCVRNSGFGLHLAHLLAKALGSKLHLTTLEQCRPLLNADMRNAMEESQRKWDETRRKNGTLSCDIDKGGGEFGGVDSDRSVSSSSDCGSSNWSSVTPGIGTVLYITVLVDDVSENAHVNHPYQIQVLPKAEEAVGGPSTQKDPIPVISVGPEMPVAGPRIPSYLFCPRPAPNSPDGTFRILVADDVKMLRKGLVHNLLNLFSDVPLSICTACTAEDVLRATADQPFDLLICDNQFLHDPTAVQGLSKDEPGGRRPCLHYDPRATIPPNVRQLEAQFFETERFTLRSGDGALTGYDALQQLAATATTLSSIKGSNFAPPVLVLLSGHKWDIPPSPGVIVVQKPLHKSDFAPLLERHAGTLLETGFCREEGSHGDDDTHGSDRGGVGGEGNGGGDPAADPPFQHPPTIVNRNGSQMFILRNNNTV